MGRTLTSNRTHASLGYLIVCAGGVCGLMLIGGCAGSGETRASSDPSKPVNTSLSQLDKSPALGLPDQNELIAPSRDEAAIRSQIEESARQLSVYFTNLEIDGPAAVGSTTPPPAATSPERVAVKPKAAEKNAATAQRRAQPNPDVVAGDDGDVRVSLMDLAGGSIESDPEMVNGSPVDSDSESPSVQAAEPIGVASTQPEPGVQGQAAAQPSDPQLRRDELAKELAGILGELIESGQHPGASALALASLETLLPDDTGALVADGVLSEPERASIDAVRSLLDSMTSEGEIASPDAVSNALETIKAELDAWAGLSIRHAALCTRVDGYGRYETFPSYRFIAGQPQEVIVYTELERFAQQITMGPDGQPRYGIELSQRLELYHAADDLNTWNRAAETLRDESRNRLRDYYLTNRVWLPGNLGVGRYHLKVVMRDLLGDKLAETIIPIEIVAR